MSKPRLPARDPWHYMRQFTYARIALGRAGASVPTSELLDFELAHARARDAVHAEFRAEELAREIQRLGQECVLTKSAAPDTLVFLQRPDLGRRLDESSRQLLQQRTNESIDIAIAISSGLSALAVHRQATPVLRRLIPLLKEQGFTTGPIVVVERGRVAIEDEIGQILGAKACVILIGERPGLGSPDSLGAYTVFNPRRGRIDAERNCVSNIRPEGLPPEAAASNISLILTESIRRKISGVELKIETSILGKSAPSPELGP